MNINKLIIKTLSAHGPVAPDVYAGNAPKYLTFNFPDERGTLYGDNRPRYTVVYVQIHLYLDEMEEYQEEKMQICKELKAAGFLWPSVTVMRDPDTGKRHIVFETQIKNRIGKEEE